MPNYPRFLTDLHEYKDVCIITPPNHGIYEPKLLPPLGENREKHYKKMAEPPKHKTRPKWTAKLDEKKDLVLVDLSEDRLKRCLVMATPPLHRQRQKWHEPVPEPRREIGYPKDMARVQEMATPPKHRQHQKYQKPPPKEYKRLLGAVNSEIVEKLYNPPMSAKMQEIKKLQMSPKKLTKVSFKGAPKLSETKPRTKGY